MYNLTLENITFVIAILAALFSVYNYFRKPQEQLEKRQALADKDIGDRATLLAAQEMETKALLLAQQVESEKVLNEKKFNEMTGNLNAAIAGLQKNIHDVDTKVDGLIASYGLWHLDVSNRITELSTIIRERLPANKNV